MRPWQPCHRRPRSTSGWWTRPRGASGASRSGCRMRSCSRGWWRSTSSGSGWLSSPRCSCPGRSRRLICGICASCAACRSSPGTGAGSRPHAGPASWATPCTRLWRSSRAPGRSCRRPAPPVRVPCRGRSVSRGRCRSRGWRASRCGAAPCTRRGRGPLSEAGLLRRRPP